MSAIYFAIPTNAGLAKIANALALGIPLKITAMAVGDGGGQAVTPDPAMTTLPGEKRRAPLNTLFQDPLNPAQLVAEQIIPENVGGWWIRCVSLYDETGTMIAIANSPDTYKPQLSEGSGRTQTIRMVLIVSDTSAVELKIDPAVVLATREYVDKSVLPRIKSGQPMPSTDIGVIWVDDWGALAYWQIFNQNGANWAGYATHMLGQSYLDTRTTPRKGSIKTGSQTLSKTTYAALRAYCQHHGRMVAVGAWKAGELTAADNADGTTFRIWDERGQFMRIFNDGSNIDQGRVFGSKQSDAIQGHAHGTTQAGYSNTDGTNQGFIRSGISNQFGAYPISVTGVISDAEYGTARIASETRPVSAAYQGAIYAF
ncbi:phage tail protein [Aeromonas bestiarum]|uniref:Phage tail protein n=1 Tax=Aeromonas bestiarum TaxID=105751 RepID=A0AAW7I6H5_9GAMM|nr:phage tail protein [Aeromonas bestiarum]MDM5141525.1 phage tail protein [Aeromonas bestiarum]